MKCNSYKFFTIFILFLNSNFLIILNSCKSDKINSTLSTTFNEGESISYLNFAMMAISARKPLIDSCKECLHPSKDGYKMFFFYQYQKSKNSCRFVGEKNH